MYYFYSIHHKRSNVRSLSISTFNPLSKPFFIGFRKEWKKFLKQYSPGVSEKELSKEITITVMHESPDLNVIKQWQKHYNNCWKTADNPKFIDYYIKQQSEKNRKKNKHVSKQGHNLKGKGNDSYTIKYKLRWYNNGYKNLRAIEGKQPSGYKLGRITRDIMSKRILGVESRKRMGYKSRAVVAPTGTVFASLTEAAETYKVSRSAISKRIKDNKLGDKGWRLL